MSPCACACSIPALTGTGKTRIITPITAILLVGYELTTSVVERVVKMHASEPETCFRGKHLLPQKLEAHLWLDIHVPLVTLMTWNGREATCCASGALCRLRLLGKRDSAVR
jgi:hypothetical protein